MFTKDLTGTTPDTETDGHNDLAIVIRYVYGSKIYKEEFTKPFEKGGLKYHVDLPRLKEGKSGGAFWSAFVLCPKNGTDFSNANYAECKSCKSASAAAPQPLHFVFPFTLSLLDLL